MGGDLFVRKRDRKRADKRAKRASSYPYDCGYSVWDVWVALPSPPLTEPLPTLGFHATSSCRIGAKSQGGGIGLQSEP